MALQFEDLLHTLPAEQQIHNGNPIRKRDVLVVAAKRIRQLERERGMLWQEASQLKERVEPTSGILPPQLSEYAMQFDHFYGVESCSHSQQEPLSLSPKLNRHHGRYTAPLNAGVEVHDFINDLGLSAFLGEPPPYNSIYEVAFNESDAASALSTWCAPVLRGTAQPNFKRNQGLWGLAASFQADDNSLKPDPDTTGTLLGDCNPSVFNFDGGQLVKFSPRIKREEFFSLSPAPLGRCAVGGDRLSGGATSELLVSTTIDTPGCFPQAFAP